MSGKYIPKDTERVKNILVVIKMPLLFRDYGSATVQIFAGTWMCYRYRHQITDVDRFLEEISKVIGRQDYIFGVDLALMLHAKHRGIVKVAD